MMKPTPRGADVIRRARQLGLSAEYVGPGVKIDGKTWAVSHAGAYVQGYFDGSARAHRSAAKSRQCPDCCGGMEMTCPDCGRREGANR